MTEEHTVQAWRSRPSAPVGPGPRGSARSYAQAWFGASVRGASLAACLAALFACSDPATPGSRLPIELEVVASGLDAPLHLTAPPGDERRLFIVERGGRIRIVRDGVLLPTPFLDIGGRVSSGGEQGLLGMAFHPDYEANGFFYVDYTDTSGDTKVVRYGVSSDPDRAEAGPDVTILSVAQPFPNHNGGLVAFGPDGMLYVGLGDGGSSGDPRGNGQDPSTLLGSLLRVDVDAASPYAVPPDNPFVGEPSARPEVWAYGLRNPWRFSFDRQTGDLYIGDVGQGAREEISFQPAASAGGENYGWNVMEGTACFEPPNGCDASGLTPPVLDYPHGEGCSVTGGHVYRGADFPELRGRYFYADFCATWIRSLRIEDGEAVDVQDHTQQLGPVEGVSSFGEDARGELYVVSLEGTVYRIVME